MFRPAFLLSLAFTLAACVSQSGRPPTASDFSRAPDARGVSGVNPRATAILTRIAIEDED